MAADPSHGRALTVGLVLALILGTAAVALARTGAGVLAPVQGEVPFPVVQPSYVPPGLTLLAAHASPPPAAVPNGAWIVQLGYGSGHSVAILVSEIGWAGGPASPVPLTLKRGTAGNGAPDVSAQFSAAGREFVVSGLREPEATVLRVARSLLAELQPR